MFGRSISRYAAAAAATATPSAGDQAVAGTIPTTPFEALGLAPPRSSTHYSSAEIKAAYKRTALRVHPDVAGGSQRHFVLAQSALKVLENNPNDTMTWVGGKEFAGCCPRYDKPPAAAAAPTTPEPRQTAASAAASYSAHHWRDFNDGDAPHRKTQEQIRQQQAKPRGVAFEDDFFGCDTEINVQPGAQKVRRQPRRGGVKNTSPSEAPSTVQGFQSHTHNRNWYSEALAQYYALREGRWLEYVKNESERRAKVKEARKEMASEYRSAMTRIDPHHRVGTLSGFEEPLCPMWTDPTGTGGYDSLIQLNAAVCYVLGIGSIFVYFYCSIEMARLRV